MRPHGERIKFVLKRTAVVQEVQTNSAVAQLLGLLDGLTAQGVDGVKRH